MAKILDNILCTVMVFLLTFAWATYCLKNLKLAIAVALIVALCACYIIFAVLNKLEKRQNVKGKKKKLLNDFAIFLQFNCDNSVIFMPMLHYYNYETEVLDFDNIIITKDKKTFVALCFESDTVKLPQIRKAVVTAKRQNCQQLFVFGNKFDSGLLTLANSQFPTKFIDVENTLQLFEHSQTLPNIPESKKIKQQILPKIAFNKKRFGWYFSGAIFMLFTSFFSFFKLYSLIWATVLFGLSLYSLFNKRFNKQPTNVSLE